MNAHRTSDAAFYREARALGGLRYTAETYQCATVAGTTEFGWCVKLGEDTVCDVRTELEAQRVADLLNGDEVPL